MSNVAYYKYEAAMIEIIRNADADTLRGAMAGMLKHSFNADFNRSTHDGLRCNALPGSDLRKALDDLKELP